MQYYKVKAHEAERALVSTERVSAPTNLKEKELRDIGIKKQLRLMCAADDEVQQIRGRSAASGTDALRLELHDAYKLIAR